MSLLKGIGNVFEENETESHMLILGRVHVAAHLIGRLPELLLKAEVGAVGGLDCRFVCSRSHHLEFVVLYTQDRDQPKEIVV